MISKKKIEVVILCGGYGKRIRKISNGKPKPLIDFFNKPFLYIILNNLEKLNIKNIILLTFYKSSMFKKIKKDFPELNLNIYKEKEKLGTGGGLIRIKKKLKNKFFVLNGDTFFSLNLNSLKKKIEGNYAFLPLMKKNIRTKYNYKIVDKNNLIFKKISKDNIVCSGIYLLNKKILNNKIFKNKKYLDLDKDIIWPHINKKKIKGQIFDEQIFDIGDGINEFNLAKKKINKILKKPCCFLDRDGVINYDYGYVGKIRKFKWMPGVKKAIRYLNKKNYYVIIVTNQAGIAYGYYSEKDFYNLNSYIRSNLSEGKTYLDKIYFCPYHIKSKIKKYKKNSQLRKPGTGMLKKAFKDFHILKSKSFLIGDKISDALCANNYGLKYYKAKGNLYNQIIKIVK